MTVVRRVLAEKRSLLVPLALAAAVNAGVYALVVRPLEVKSAGAADRAAAASEALTLAERDAEAARALVTGKTRADQELATFYSRVVPPDLSAARRMTYATLPALARKANVRYEQRRVDIDQTRSADNNGRLGHLQIRMVLQGDYEAVRRFIYELETAPQFVIIDDITLTQADSTKPITLTLELSTYYRLGASGG